LKVKTGKMSDQWHGGKGYRRKKGDDKAYLDNWERLFGKKKIDINDLKNIVKTKKKVDKSGTK
jgi:hypothetical protein